MNILKEYIKEILFEKAKEIGQLSGSALFIGKSDGYTNVILYSANELIEKAKYEMKEKGDLYELKFPILGVLKIEPGDNKSCNKSDFVAISAAEKGYGPLMYDIGISLSRNNTLSSDRSIVSTSAKGIWNFYKQNRGDVIRKDFDDQSNPRTPDPTDDCKIYGKEPGQNPLDSAYTLKSHPNYSNLLEINKQVFKLLNNMFPKFTYEFFSEQIVDQSVEFFYDKHAG